MMTETSLGDEKTYKKLKGEPTRKFKGELVRILKDFKERRVITSDLHEKLYPTVDRPTRFYGLPKVHKANSPLRPHCELHWCHYICQCKIFGGHPIISRKLKDESLSNRTPLSPNDIIILLEKCLNCKYFLHKGLFYL